MNVDPNPSDRTLTLTKAYVKIPNLKYPSLVQHPSNAFRFISLYFELLWWDAVSARGHL